MLKKDKWGKTESQKRIVIKKDLRVKPEGDII